MTDITKMKADIKEWRENGREPKEYFVSEAMAAVLVERCKPLFRYVTRYARLCGDANEILHANIEAFSKYENYLALIRRSECHRKMFAVGLTSAKNRMVEAQDYSSASRYAYSLGLALTLAKFGYEVNFRGDSAEYERLKTDEAYFNAEVERYMAKIKEESE